MNHTFPSFQHLVDRAIITENKRREMEEKKRKKNEKHSGSNSRPRLFGSQNTQQRSYNQQDDSEASQQYPRYNNQYQRSNHQNQQQQQDDQPSQQAAPASTPQKTPGPSGGNNCYKCGGTGHFSRQCPQRSATPQTPQQPIRGGTSGQASGTRGSQQFASGKINHVSADTVQGTPGVLLGTFLVNSHPATVLFDTGASHSFATTQFIDQIGLARVPMETPMLVSSPGGKIKTSSMCPTAFIEIRG